MKPYHRIFCMQFIFYAYAFDVSISKRCEHDFAHDDLAGLAQFQSQAPSPLARRTPFLSSARRFRTAHGRQTRLLDLDRPGVVRCALEGHVRVEFDP